MARDLTKRDPIRTAVVLTHSSPAETGEALRAAALTAKTAGVRLLIDADDVGKHGDAGEGIESAEHLGAGERPDLCLALGGDGTILRGLRTYAGEGVPVFGINYGTIGFLAATEADSLQSGLERAFAGEFEEVDLPGLAIGTDGGEVLALNDVSFTRRPHHRVAELSYRLGGQEVGHVSCDGLVAATPVGSTGYNLANGGPILAWGVEGYVVSFIAPHTLTARALVVAPDDVLHVLNSAERDPVEIAIDGRPTDELAAGAEREVSFRDGVGRLAQFEGATFYRRIREKFGRLAYSGSDSLRL